jgi:hypothetical protein
MIPLGFAAPLALLGLAALPAIWWLLRVTPPRPRQTPFPPLKLILDLRAREETPARMPPWLLILRLLLAALVVLAMAGPVWNPRPAATTAGGPALVVIDDGWPAAPQWDTRVAAAARALEGAARDGRPAVVFALSDGARAPMPDDARRALEKLRALAPKPWLPDRTAALPALEAFLKAHPGASVLYVADDVDEGGGRAFAGRLAALAPTARVARGDISARALSLPEQTGAALELRVLRARADGSAQGRAVAHDARGAIVGEAEFDFGAGLETRAAFDLPVELRNEIARVDIAGERSAGATALIDERWRRRRVAIFSGAASDLSQPLLAPNYYLRKAMAPFADVREARPGAADPIAALVEDKPSVLALADVGALAGATHDRLAAYVENGGVLLRFAGTRLAAGNDDLIPVRLRRGGRVLGGALSWEKPKTLAAFSRESPFFGVVAPAEVSVSRQVLAEPDPGLAGKTWAQLADGTPLVTAGRRGKGLVVLFHVTADTSWSNLPLSGLFVDMLRRVVMLAGEGAGEATQEAGEPARALAPLRLLDGFGALGPPPPTARPLPVDEAGPARAEHPPGFYGAAEAPRAFNALRAGDRLTALDLSGLALAEDDLRAAGPVDLRPALAMAAFLAFLADSLATLWLGGGFAAFRRATAVLAVGLLCAGLAVIQAPQAVAQPQKPAAPIQTSPRDIEAALTTRLAYVVTGDARADAASRDGLTTLTRVLGQRTTINAGDPVGVDPARDELAFYPLLYWPVVAGRPIPPDAVKARVSAYMKQGGVIVFDTRDALTARPGVVSPEAQWLRKALDGVDVPELERLPRDHVVTKTFYLLDGFVGRTANGETWIEALPPEPEGDGPRPARSGDSVSPIVIVSNDLAAGWAADRSGEGLYPLTPGGARQREMAIRGGVNLVMYTLTGNYKADQVHVRDLLKRLER